MSKQSYPTYQPDSPATVLWFALSPFIACTVAGLLWFVWYIRPLNVTKEFGVQRPQTAAVQPNAAVFYGQAFEKFLASGSSAEPVSWVLDHTGKGEEADTPQRYPLAQKQRWIERNREAFALLDKAAKTPAYSLRLLAASSFMGDFQSRRMSQLARFSFIRSEAWTAEQKYEQSVQNALDIWKMGLRMQTVDSYSTARIGMGIEGFAQKALDKNIEFLTAGQARQTIKQLEEIGILRPTIQELIHAEYANQMLHLERSVKFQVTKNSFYTLPLSQFRFPLSGLASRRQAREFHALAKPMLDSTELPWSQWSRRPPSYSLDMRWEMEPIRSASTDGRYFQARYATRYNLTLAQLALLAYHKEHGSYPATTKELVPGYLAKMPTDTFADGKPVRYRRVGQQYELSSLEPNREYGSEEPLVPPRRPPGFIGGPPTSL